MFSFFFSSRRRHTRWPRDWSSDVCSSDLVGLVAPGFPGLLVGFVLELAVVHEFCHGWASIWGNLDEVEARFPSKTQRVVDAHNSYLLTIGSDESYFGHIDPLVNAGLADVLSPSLTMVVIRYKWERPPLAVARGGLKVSKPGWANADRQR